MNIGGVCRLDGNQLCYHVYCYIHSNYRHTDVATPAHTHVNTYTCTHLRIHTLQAGAGIYYEGKEDDQE
jgi:hypothetical protein